MDNRFWASSEIHLDSLPNVVDFLLRTTFFVAEILHLMVMALQHCLASTSYGYASPFYNRRCDMMQIMVLLRNPFQILLWYIADYDLTKK